MTFPYTTDQLLANATNFLVEGQEFYEASILLLCRQLKAKIQYGSLFIELTANRAVCEIINDEEQPTSITIRRAFSCVLPDEFSLGRITACTIMENYDADWRAKLLEVVEGKIPLNQGIPIQDKPRFDWHYLFFRSPHEIKIAEALDAYKVLFLPNCMARFSSPNPQERCNREADFLVCYEGKWGIIEVDGETTHPSAAKDHERDRLFHSYGIRVIQRYSAERCTNNPKGVVREFLELLNKIG